MEYPKITIITPSFNQGQYLGQTIQSVLNQGYPNLEYIVVDGGSTDNSIEIIKKYENRITYWETEKDKGQSDAINKGLIRATGEIVNWINSDDYYEPNALFAVAEAFRESSINVVCGRSRLFRNFNETLSYSKGTDIYPNNLAKTIGWSRIDQPETFFRRSVIEKMGLLDTSLHYLMDRDWWIKYLFIFGLKGVAKIEDVLVNFRLHNASKTVSQKEKFQVEHDSFYYSLAKEFNLYKYMNLYKEVCAINENFTIQMVDTYNQALVERALNYYTLLRANELYAQNDRHKAQILLEQIEKKWLAETDTALYNKLYWRNKYVPQFVINLLRKK